MQKIIVILGPTSAGKSSLAIKLAQKFNGEIISADSRQVYKGMDLGTGKVFRDRILKIKNYKFKIPPEYISGGVSHHLLDVASPKKQFTVDDFKNSTNKAISQINKQKKLPFLVGGSAFYIYSVIDNWTIPNVKPNPALRKKLEKLSVKQLFSKLVKLDPHRAANIDQYNKRRLVRALEIINATKKPIPKSNPFSLPPTPYLILGLNKPRPTLYKLIDKRVDARLKQGMIKEVQQLLKSGITHKRLQSFGLEYKFISLFLQKKLSKEQMTTGLKKAIHHFAKRQMTWWKNDSRIHWVKNQQQAETLIRAYLKH
jgi:tRNA dimethylallyltransferase